METNKIARINAIPNSEIKQRAWNILMQNPKKSILFILFYLFIAIIISIPFDTRIWGINKSSAPITYIFANLISATLCYLILAPITVGFYKFFLECSRNFPTPYSVLFFGYKKYVRNTIAILLIDFIFYGLFAIINAALAIICLILAAFLIGEINSSVPILVLLSNILSFFEMPLDKSLICIFISIVVIAFSVFILYQTFALVELFPFVLADDNKTGATNLLRSFWEKSSPYNLKMINLYLSFIGWWILAIFTLGIAMLWIGPYWSYAKTELYKEIIGKEKTKDTEAQE